MGTSLQYLHQNLYQLKNSRLMDNDVFKQLYYEAKGHEKNVNLNNLATRSKNDKLYQETNFYLILTNMLNELKELDPTSDDFSKNLEKIYRWYLKNKEPFSKNEKNKSTNISKENYLNLQTNRSLQNDLKTERNLSRFQLLKTNRELSPIYFPTLKNVIKPESYSPGNPNLARNSPLNINELKAQLSNKTTDENRVNDRSQLNKSQMSMRSEKNDKLIEEKQNLEKNTLDEKSRSEILKALSVYADQIYSNIDKTDTKKLEANLKSLSKFYNTLNDLNSFNSTVQSKEKKSSVTLSSLIEVAKEVSDKMILSKNQLNIRMNENRQLIESLRLKQEPSELKSEKSFNENTEEYASQELTENGTNNAMVYSVLTRDINKRPKSTAFTDWRGCISRPSTAKKSKSVIRFNLTSTTPRPKSSVSISQVVEVSDTNHTKPESDQNDEEITDKIKRQRSFTKLKHISREATSSCSEGKEVKYVTFIARIKEKKNDSNEPPKSLLETLEDKTLSHMTVSETINDVDIKQSDNLTENLTETEQTSQTTKMLRCLNNEIIECECCRFPRTPSPSFVKNDIFHLTYVNDEHKNSDEKRKNLVSLADPTPNPEQSQTIGLREILLSNYDPQFAARIGIPNFIPLQLMTADANGQEKDLEFIPFENIDSSYPKVNGFPVYDPNYNKPQRKLYRTNPSIPRPESKYGTRSSVYEQILELKRQNLNQDALVVWQPEDVNLVRDLLDLEQAPLRETLKVEGLKSDVKNENNELVEYDNGEKSKRITNTQITAMGRPVNAASRWRTKEENNQEKPIDQNDNVEKIKNEEYEALASNSDLISDITPKAKLPSLKLTGNSMYKKFEEHLYEGRPLPTARTTSDPEKDDLALIKFNEAKQAVHIPSIFKGSTVGRNYVKEYDLEEIAKREDERKAAIKIQRQYRKHLYRKQVIEKRSDPEALVWAINHRNELQKRKLEREAKLLEEKQKIEKENARFKALIKKIGIHADLHQILHQKGSEYTNKVLNKAAICIQKWIKGWLVRKEIKKLKSVIINDGLDWKTFTNNYRKTILRIQKMRGSYNYECEFISSEALEFFQREKKFTSYFNKLAFSNEIDLNDINKMFNFVDLYPNNEEIQEAKLNVLKYYKRKANSTSISKRAMFDIIYYIYPPAGTKLKSTRKSTWTNPVVDGEDALRLKGFKLIESTVLEKSWKMVREQSTAERLKSSLPPAINKNTPVPNFDEQI